jgi:hypothetical protein
VKVVMVRQRGEGAELVFMLVSQPIQLTRENDRRRKHSRASNPEWEIGILPVPLRFSAAARPTIRDSEWVCMGKGRRRMTRLNERARGVLGKE